MAKKKKAARVVGPYLTVYLDDELANALQKLKLEQGKTKTFVVREALKKYLNIN